MIISPILKLHRIINGRQTINDRKNVNYTDKEATIEDSLAGKKQLTQFGKCCDKLNISIIPTHSPQAKGRLEQKNGVLQERLDIGLKLKGIKDMFTVNNALVGSY